MDDILYIALAEPESGSFPVTIAHALWIGNKGYQETAYLRRATNEEILKFVAMRLETNADNISAEDWLYILMPPYMVGTLDGERRRDFEAKDTHMLTKKEIMRWFERADLFWQYK